MMVIILLVLSYHPAPAQAISTSHGGLFWQDHLIIGNFTYWGFSGQVSELDAEYIDLMANAGVKIIQTVLWWCDEVSNPLDVYYNETVQNWLKELVNYNIYGTPPSFFPPDSEPAGTVNTDSLYGIIIGDEEPAWTRINDIYSNVSDDIAKYNSTYHSETGFYLKPIYECNLTEYWSFTEWLNEKTVWTYNFIYDYLKSIIPNIRIYQYTMMPPVWGMSDELCAPYELNGEGQIMDCYYAKDDPWLLYETTRRYKTTLPDREFQMVIWGTIWDFINDAGDGLRYHEGSYEQMRQETWVSYLSGVDVLGYFDWAPVNNDSYYWAFGHVREDIMGKRLWRYVNDLAGQLAKLPVLTPKPEVLIIGNGFDTDEPMPNVAMYDLFTEYDLVNQRCFAMTDIDMSNYSLVLVTDGWYYNETINKLNEYVANGGNLLFLKGIGEGSSPDGAISKYDIEVNATQSFISKHLNISIDGSNILGLALEYDAPFHQSYMLQFDNLTYDYYPIGDFYWIDENNTSHLVDGYPLILYHNKSEPSSGWMLYWGALHSSTVPNTEWENYDLYNETDLWDLGQVIVRRFAKFLNITNSISTESTENMIITQGLVDDGTLIAGICNLRNESRFLNYTVDLRKFNLSDGEYWVHSLDANLSLGSFHSDNGVLSFPIDVVINGTRLLLISQSPPQPNYSINIFPHIPTIAEVNETTATTTILPTITTPSPTATPTTSETNTLPSTTTPSNSEAFIMAIGIFSGGFIVITVVYLRRRNIKH